MKLNLNINDLVRHPEALEWGVGRILHVAEDGHVDIVFSKHSKTTLNLTDASWQLIKLDRGPESLIQYHKEFLEERNIPYCGVRMRDPNKGRREVHCYNCGLDLDSNIDAECNICGWILYHCGACGCGHPLYGPKYTSKIVLADKAHILVSPDARMTTRPTVVYFSVFEDAMTFAKTNPGSDLTRNGSGWSVQVD